MKIRSDFVLSEVAGMTGVVPLGGNTTFHNMIKLNETGKLLWESLGSDTTREALASVLVEKYGIEKELALSDVDAFLASLAEFGALEE